MLKVEAAEKHVVNTRVTRFSLLLGEDHIEIGSTQGATRGASHQALIQPVDEFNG